MQFLIFSKQDPVGAVEKVRGFSETCCGEKQTCRLYGGGRGIRTPGTVSGTAVFKTARFNHSRIPPTFKTNILENRYCVLLSCYCTLNRSTLLSRTWTSHSS